MGFVFGVGEAEGSGVGEGGECLEVGEWVAEGDGTV